MATPSCPLQARALCASARRVPDIGPKEGLDWLTPFWDPWAYMPQGCLLKLLYAGLGNALKTPSPHGCVTPPAVHTLQTNSLRKVNIGVLASSSRPCQALRLHYSHHWGERRASRRKISWQALLNEQITPHRQTAKEALVAMGALSRDLALSPTFKLPQENPNLKRIQSSSDEQPSTAPKPRV